VSLTSNVQARYSTQRIRHLTNPDAPNATSLDATRLADAVADVEAEFRIRAGVVYDDTDARHVSVGVRGVVAVLEDRMGAGGGEKRMEAFREDLDALRKVTSNDRLRPATNSVMVPTPEGEGRTTPVRPAFDDRAFRGLIPDRPHGPEAGLDSDED